MEEDDEEVEETKTNNKGRNLLLYLLDLRLLPLPLTLPLTLPKIRLIDNPLRVRVVVLIFSSFFLNNYGSFVYVTLEHTRIDRLLLSAS
jgi:hypothetical protein